MLVLDSPRRTPAAIALVAVLVLAACDTRSASDSHLPVIAGHATSVRTTTEGWQATSDQDGQLLLPADTRGAVDIWFRPVALVEGEALVATSGDVRLISQLNEGLHRVSASAPAGRALRVEGSRSGVVQGSASLDPEQSDHPVGHTQSAPTSVHRRYDCTGGVCTEVIVYDYNLTEPTAAGTTAWRASDGSTQLIDELRLLVALPIYGQAYRNEAVILSGFRELNGVVK